MWPSGGQYTTDQQRQAEHGLAQVPYTSAPPYIQLTQAMTAYPTGVLPTRTAEYGGWPIALPHAGLQAQQYGVPSQQYMVVPPGTSLPYHGMLSPLPGRFNPSAAPAAQQSAPLATHPRPSASWHARTPTGRMGGHITSTTRGDRGGRGYAGRGRGRRGMGWHGGRSEDGSSAAVDALASAIRKTHPSSALSEPMLREGLSRIDSRGLSALLKELARGHQAARGSELFQWLQSLPPGDDLSRLCDVFTYTAMISLCTEPHQLQRAFNLVEEMRHKRIVLNVHTYR